MHNTQEQCLVYSKPSLEYIVRECWSFAKIIIPKLLIVTVFSVSLNKNTFFFALLVRE